MTEILDALESDARLDAGEQAAAIVARYFAATRDEAVPVSPVAPGAALAERFAEPMPQDGRPLAEVLARLERDVVGTANHLTHPMYLGHQVSAPLPAAVWTESIIGALNNSLAVAEMSPPGTAIEYTLIRWLCELVGYGNGAGGTLTSGGTEATLTALLAARSVAIPDVWENGVGTSPPVLVCGEHTHYAVTRAAGEMGLGRRALVLIPSRDYRMDVDALERALDTLARDGRRVMAVVATAGSTATGSFDDLERIGDLCEARGIWLHVDGAHGASALLSTAHARRMRGIEKARSLAWDPHKMMHVPISAGVVLVRDERVLERAFAQRAPYLFRDGDGERTWDQGVRSFQCSRRADALKVWVTLQRYGAKGIGALYDYLCALTVTFARMLRDDRRFEVLHEPECNILCFRWVGDGSPDDATLDACNAELRERYNRSGEGWITATTLDGRRVLRVTIQNARTREEHLARLIEGLAREADRLSGAVTK